MLRFQDINGNIGKDNKENVKIVEDFYKRLFSKPESVDQSVIDNLRQDPVLIHLDRTPSDEELKAAVKKLKIGQSAESGCVGEYYKAFIGESSIME
jgi:hypothetical protein